VLLALFFAAPLAWADPVPDSSGIGEAIYRDGRLADGASLKGERVGAMPMLGANAACAKCHGRSGLGKIEGKFVIPPIAGRILLHPGVRIIHEADLHGDPMHHMPPTPRDRKAYDDASLARAIREGIDPDGRELDYLMPRFDIDDASMRALVDYLKNLSSGQMPGLREGTLQLATIVTADADPVVRVAMLQVLNQFIQERNARQTAGVQAPLGSDAMRFRATRRWVLNVWELKGDASTWEKQLDDYFRRGPVFAVISGLGRTTWGPVDRFCERRAIPCVLPNVDLPGSASGSYFSIYFSQGVLLEARLIADRLTKAPADTRARRIVQVYREGDIGEAAASRLREILGSTVPIRDSSLGAQAGAREIERALGNVNSGDALVLWLRPEDLAQLPAPPRSIAPLPAGEGPGVRGERKPTVEGSLVFVSGLMGGLEAAPLPGAWRERALMAYPVALPDERASFLNYPLGWFHRNRIPVVDERVQVDTYVACSELADAVASMLDEFVPDYLIERVESTMETRLINGFYRHLGLESDDHFASKGGYLVRFEGPKGTKVHADGSWVVPSSDYDFRNSHEERKFP
jgi:hypothetical protein